MTSRIVALELDAQDPLRLGVFWSGVLGLEMVEDPSDDGVILLPGRLSGPSAFRIELYPRDEPKSLPNQMHFDLTSTSLEDQQATVARVLELGGSHLDVGQGPDADHVVLADPEGNEFCVIEPWNDFLSDTAVIGALSSDGSQAVGYFWSQALGWPLVWDQDEETAIQSPQGGTKISWGGRRGDRRPARTGCTSSSRLLPAPITMRRSSGWSPSGRSGSTSARATSTGRSWLTRTATSSAS